MAPGAAPPSSRQLKHFCAQTRLDACRLLQPLDLHGRDAKDWKKGAATTVHSAELTIKKYAVAALITSGQHENFGPTVLSQVRNFHIV